MRTIPGGSPLAKPRQAITAYSPTLLSQAGYSSLTQNGLAGGLNTIGIVGTIISAQIVDRIGRRMCLMLGALSLFIVEVVVSLPLLPE
jgi:MFS family permease